MFFDQKITPMVAWEYLKLSPLPMGVLDYHTEDLLRREDFILSTRFARMDPTECFFVFRLDRRMKGMTDRWQCESTCF